MYQQLMRVLHVIQELMLSTIEMLITTCQPKQVPFFSYQLAVGDDISTNEMPYCPLQLLLLRLLENFDSIYPVQKYSELLAGSNSSPTELRTFAKAKDKPTFHANSLHKLCLMDMI